MPSSQGTVRTSLQRKRRIELSNKVVLSVQNLLRMSQFERAILQDVSTTRLPVKLHHGTNS
jgi:hypothetical protein